MWRRIFVTGFLLAAMLATGTVVMSAATAQEDRLTLSITASPSPAEYKGADISLTYRIHNGLSNRLIDVSLTYTLPAGLTVVARDSRCGISSCTLRPIPAGNALEVRFRLRPSAVGTFHAIGSVRGTERCPPPRLAAMSAFCDEEHTVRAATSFAVLFSGPLATASVTAAPRPGFLGGDNIAVIYTITNRMPARLFNVALTPSLPGQLEVASRDPRCQEPVCQLGIIEGETAVTVRFELRPSAAGDFQARGTFSGHHFCPGGTCSARPIAVDAGTAEITVVAPVLTVDPAVGPPGLVALATGASFPPGAVVRLQWRPGITETANTVTAGPDGTFAWQALVFRGDQLGPRELVAQWVSGPRFGPVAVPFLVTAPRWEPPLPHEGW